MKRVLLPLWFMSFTSAAGPVTYVVTPFGAGVRFTILPDSIHRFVSQGRALVTGEIDLDVYAFTVGALRARRRERIAPEILDVLHVLRIVFQLTNHAVVVPVRVVAEFLLAFQDDHRETVGIRFLEFLAHRLHRLHRRRIFRAQ